MPILGSILRISAADYLKFDAALSAILGVILFVAPSTVVDQFVSGTTDGVQFHLTRCVGAQMIAMSYVLYKASKSRYPEFQTSCLVFRMVVSALTIAMTLHAKVFFAKHFVSYIFPLIFTCCTVSIIVSLYHLIKTGWPLGPVLVGKDQKLANCLVHADHLAATIIGCVWMAFPEWILRRQVTIQLNGTHMLLGKWMGASFLASGMFNSNALYWSSSDDRKCIAVGRAIMCAGILSAQLYSQVGYHDAWTNRHWVGITLFSVWTSLVAYYGRQIQTKKFV